MALEMATAMVRVRADRAQVRTEFRAVRRLIISELSKIRVPIQIVPVFNARSMAAVQNAIAGSAGGMAGGRAGARGINGNWAQMVASAQRNRPNVQNPFTAPNATDGTNREGRANRFTSIGGFAKGSMQVGTGIIGAHAAMATLMAPVKMLQAASSFEQSMITIKQVTQATRVEMEALQEAALKMASETKFRANEVADAMAKLSRKGLDVREVIDMAPLVLALATANEVSAERAADVLTGVKNSMRLTVDQLEEASDVITRLTTRSSADFDDFANAFRYLGPIAGLAKMEFKEIAAIIGSLSNVELKASFGGTGARGVIADLANPTKLKKAAELLGSTLDPATMTGNFKEFAQIVDEANAALSNKTPLEKMTFAIQVFGKRAGPAFAALLTQGGDSLRNLLREFNDGTKTMDFANARMESLRGSADRMLAAFDVLSIKFIGPIKSSLTTLGNAFANVVVSVANADLPFVRLLLATGAVAGSIKLFTAALFGLGRLLKSTVFLKGALIVATTSLILKMTGAYDAVTKLNRALERQLELRSKLAGGISGRQQATLAEISGLAGDEKKTAISDAMDKANRDLEALVRQIKAYENAVKKAQEAETTGDWLLGVMTGGKSAADQAIDDLDDLKSKINSQKEFIKSLEDLGKVPGDGSELDADMNLGGTEDIKPEKKRASFIGIEELSKQIQLSILDKEKEKTQKSIEANTAAAAKELAAMRRDKSPGVFS